MDDGKLIIGILSFVSLCVGVCLVIGPLRRIDDPSKWKGKYDGPFGQLGTDPWQLWAGWLFLTGGMVCVTFALERIADYFQLIK